MKSKKEGLENLMQPNAKAHRENVHKRKHIL